MGVMIAALNNIPFTILIALLKGIRSHAKPAHTLWQALVHNTEHALTARHRSSIRKKTCQPGSWSFCCRFIAT